MCIFYCNKIYFKKSRSNSHISFFFFSPFFLQWQRIMHATNSRGRSPAFLQPQNGNGHRSSGYVPGKVVPLRPPPPPKSQASAKCPSIRQEARASFAFSPEEQQAQGGSQKQKRHKNTFICFAVTSFSFFVALAVILGISSKYAPDGKCGVCVCLCTCAYRTHPSRRKNGRKQENKVKMLFYLKSALAN